MQTTSAACSPRRASASFVDFAAPCPRPGRRRRQPIRTGPLSWKPWSSNTRRSVMTITLSNTALSWSSWSFDKRCANHAIEFDFPEPAECGRGSGDQGRWREPQPPGAQHAVPLMESREDHLAGGLPGVVDLGVDEPSEQIEEGVSLPDLFPQVGGGVLAATGRRIACRCDLG